MGLRRQPIAPQHANEARNQAAKRIVELSGPNMAKVFFTNGGADAAENAIRMARLHTNKHKVLSAYRSYHGNTGAAIVATGDPRRWPNEYAAQHVHFFGPYPYRSEFWSSSPEQETERALQHLEHVIQFEGPNTIGAIILESVIGTAGVIVPPPGYMVGLRALCDKYGIVWIADEVMAGFGRTGEWFAFQNWAAQPDLIVFAKGSNSGYVPVGGVVISEENIVANAKAIGENVLGPGLRALADRHPVIGDVRGLGVFWALDLVTNRETKEPLAPYGGTSEAMGALVNACKARGLMPFTNFNRMHVVPPCTITEDEARAGLAILDEVFAEIDKYYVG